VSFRSEAAKRLMSTNGNMTTTGLAFASMSEISLPGESRNTAPNHMKLDPDRPRRFSEKRPGVHQYDGPQLE
jgi:hypothetical protein